MYENLNFYQTRNPKEYPLAPDLAIIKGVEFEHVTSWAVGRTGPAPQVVLEVASLETWKKDLTEKPRLYAQMGVQEYFAYDPHTPPLLRSRNASRRLFGWHLSSDGVQALQPDSNGRLWSTHLNSFLVPDNSLLRLTDQQGRLWLTEAQAEAYRAEAEAYRAEVEALARQAEAHRAEAEAEARRAEALAEKLRSLGIDPDQI